MLQERNGFKLSSKLSQNLCPHKWLNSNLNLVSDFIPTCHEYQLPEIVVRQTVTDVGIKFVSFSNDTRYLFGCFAEILMV